MITVPFHYPGDNEFIAVVTRMRIAGAWDPLNDWLVHKNDQGGCYAQFINDCVGYEQPHRIEAADISYHFWKTCVSLRQRGFISLVDQGSYVVRKRGPGGAGGA